MYKLKNLLIAVVVLLISISVLATLAPLVGRGQGESQNAPRHRGLRRFYLTQTQHIGSQALTACAQGYHMASVWEILDPSNLSYDTELGETGVDSGSGPPNISGWIRTGSINLTPIGPGTHCRAWTSNDNTDTGTVVTLPGVTNLQNDSVASPWIANESTCSNPIHVWCVQD